MYAPFPYLQSKIPVPKVSPKPSVTPIGTPKKSIEKNKEKKLDDEVLRIWKKVKSEYKKNINEITDLDNFEAKKAAKRRIGCEKCDKIV